MTAIACCASCGSDFVHPRAWQERAGGRLRLVLRCGECCGVSTRVYAAEEVAAYDRALADARLELTALHAAVVRSNMQEEAECLRLALKLDLISADDFAGYNRKSFSPEAPRSRR